MAETILQAAARCGVTLLDLDVVAEVCQQAPHKTRYTPARVARALEMDPARVDGILQDLTRRRVLEMHPWKRGRAYRLNPRTSEWEPPKPADDRMSVFARILGWFVRPVQT